LTTFGIAGSPTSASPAPPKVRAANISCCSRIQRRNPGRLFCRAPQHLRQLGDLPDVSRGWFAQAWRRIGQAASEDYPLADAANPAPTKFANAPGIPANFVPPGDYAFWNLLNEVIQAEPSEGSGPTTLGLFAAIGIQKGKPFNPDARMKKILEDAANIGAVTARATTFKIRDKDAFFYYFATGVTPAMAEKMVGKVSQYPWWAQDSDGNPFEGGKN
jgi:hypothetical protein